MTTTNANAPAPPKPVMMRGFGGLSAGPMPAADREWIRSETSRRCFAYATLMPADQVAAAAALAVDLYETAASYGIDRDAANGVTSFIDAAIDGIRARDRR